MLVELAGDDFVGYGRVLGAEYRMLDGRTHRAFRYELDDGVLIVSPATSRMPQLALTRLTTILSAACPGRAVVLAGVGVNINRFQHRVPEVAVVDNEGFGTMFQESPPLLVVEVASPRTRLYDRNRKKDVYQSVASRRTGS